MPLLLMVAGTPAERRRITDHVAGGHVDGVLVVSSHQRGAVVPALLRAGYRRSPAGTSAACLSAA